MKQMTAQAAVAPGLPGSDPLKTPQALGEEETTAGNQTHAVPHPPPLAQTIGYHGPIETHA